MSSNLKDTEEKLDPRVKRTRALILNSFTALIAEKGFDSVTVQDVTDKAEINRATFYAHFPDKYALLEYAIHKKFTEAVEARHLDMCNYSRDNLRNLILILCEFLRTSHASCAGPHKQFESLIEGTVKKRLFELLSRWLHNSKAPAELPATVAAWAIYGLAYYYSQLEKPPALEKFVDQAHPLVAVNLEQFA